MMILRGFNIFLFLFLSNIYCQTIVKGEVSINNIVDKDIEISIYEKNQGFITKISPNNSFEIEIYKDKIELIFIAEGYPISRKKIDFSRDGNFYIKI